MDFRSSAVRDSWAAKEEPTEPAPVVETSQEPTEPTEPTTEPAGE